MDAIDSEPDQSPHLTEYYHILTKHKWLIMASLILMTSLTTFFTFRMEPVYRAGAIMVIEKEKTTSPLTGERTDMESFYTQALSFRTHAKLIISRPVLLRMIKDLGLDQLAGDQELQVNPLKALLDRIKANFSLLLKGTEQETSPMEAEARLINALAGKIEIEEVRDTHLLNISVEDHDPDLARDIANSLTRAYIEFNVENRLNATRSTLDWMTAQMYDTKKKLEDAERDFLAYKQSVRLFSLEGKQKTTAQKMTEVSTAHLITRNQRMELDMKLSELQRSQGDGTDIQHVRSLADNPLIDSLYSRFLEAEVKRSRLSKVYRSKHPKIIQINTEIDDTRGKLQNEVQKEIKSLKARHAVLIKKEQALKQSLEDFEGDALETSRKELKYTILQRNVETNQKLYDILLTRVKESNITGQVDVSNLRIVQPAVTPHKPVKPKKKLNVALSIIFGLMTGIGLSFLWEYLDRSLRTEEDVKRYLGLSVLAVIPVARKGKAKIKDTAPDSKPPPAPGIEFKL